MNINICIAHKLWSLPLQSQTGQPLYSLYPVGHPYPQLNLLHTVKSLWVLSILKTIFIQNSLHALLCVHCFTFCIYLFWLFLICLYKYFISQKSKNISWALTTSYFFFAWLTPVTKVVLCSSGRASWTITFGFN